MRGLSIFFYLLLFSGSAGGGPLSPQDVPVPLQPWIDWAVDGEESSLCPFAYNNVQQKRCAWPTALALDLNHSGGAFSSEWRVYADSWIELPGNTMHWPQAVAADGKELPVVARGGRPS